MRNISIPANQRVLQYLKHRNPDAPLLIAIEEARDPYYALGSHPDVVGQLWNVLGRALVEDCRRIVCGTPALLHPETGVLFAFALGTQYVLRLPGGLAEDALIRGLKTVTIWAGGSRMDTRHDLGEEWVFGGYLPDEITWLQKAYEIFSADP